MESSDSSGVIMIFLRCAEFCTGVNLKESLERVSRVTFSNDSFARRQFSSESKLIQAYLSKFWVFKGSLIESETKP
jgi:hypothetical protein